MLVSTAVVMYMGEKRARLRATTIEGYESALRRHVLPRWGSVDIERIDPDDVQRWVDGFELAGAAEKAYKTLRQVVRWCMRRLRLTLRHGRRVSCSQAGTTPDTWHMWTRTARSSSATSRAAAAATG